MLELADIRKEWQTVQPGLALLVLKNEATFLPEDVFSLCATGAASLWLDRETGAFCVLQKREDLFSGEPYLFIFAACTPASLSVDTYWPQITELAKGIGAKTVKMHGSRPGWAKRSEWQLEYSCYERKI